MLTLRTWSHTRWMLTALFMAPLTLWANTAFITVIDAGSSGSRCHVYQYDDSAPLPTLLELTQQKVKPGIASFASEPDAAGKQILSLVQAADKAIAEAGGNPLDTPLYLFATAGMREISDNEQHAIYQAVSTALTAAPHAKQILETIPGWKEGIFSWLSVNYAGGTLGSKTKGMLDLGGASTQITYASREQGDNHYDFRVAGRPYSVFSLSFLGLGQDQALLHLPQFGDPTVCYPRGYPLATGRGQFDLTTCKASITDEINSFDLKTQVPLEARKKSFIALAGYYYAYDFFKVSTVAQLKTKVDAVCNRMDWDALRQQYPNEPENYLSTYCFNGTLVTTLLGDHAGYGFFPYYHNPDVKTKLGGYDIDWPLGAALYEIAGEGLTE